MKRIYVGAVMIGLLGTLGACSGKTAVEENTQVADAPKQVIVRIDEREVLPLNQLQREQVLNEMRGLLVATQGVIEGLAHDDMQAVQEAAKSASMKADGTVESKANMKRLQMGKVLPPEFRQLGQGVHVAFGEMAQMAADGKPAKDIQLKLAETMNSCVACHSAYQIPNP